MTKKTLFYFFKLNYIFIFMRKRFFFSIFLPNRLNFFVYMFWVLFFVKKVKFKNNLFLNYRYNTRLGILENRLYKGRAVRSRCYFLFRYNKINKTFKFGFLFKRNNLFINFFFNFIYYYYCFRKFLYHLLILYHNYYSLQDYFYVKRFLRFTFFEYVWIITKSVPVYWSTTVQRRFRGFFFKKKWNFAKKKKYYNYLLTMSSNFLSYFNIQQNDFFFLPKHIKLQNKLRFSRSRRLRFKKINSLLRTECQFVKKDYFFNFFFYEWLYKRRKARNYFFKLPYNLFKTWRARRRGVYLFKYLRFRYLQRIRLSIRKKAVNSIIYRNKFYFNSDRFYSLCKQKSYRSLGILGKKRRILTLNVDYSVIRKVLILVGSLANFRLLYRVSDISSIFFNLRLVYILFSDLYFIGEILYLRPVQRFTFLFKFLLNKFSRKSMSQSLMTFISNSNAIYSFFIPYYCQILLRRVYRSRKLAGFNWLFFTQLSNLFFYLFYSNLHLHLNFSCSESLNKTLLHTMLQYFLTYNPPKMNFQFLKELCDVYLLTGITRDSNLLQNWVVRNLSIIFYRKHWRFISFLKMTLVYVFRIMQIKFNIKGLFISFRGKIGQVGSVRKKALFLRQGVYSLSDISLRISFTSSITKTDTGAIGVSVGLYY